MKTLNELELTTIQKTIVKEASKSLNIKRQAFVVAAPSLGKTYIAAKLISDVIRNPEKDKVLFISTTASCNNTYQKFKDTREFNENVIMITLDELSRNEDYSKELSKIIPRKEVVKLIVIDEAHRLLASNAYKSLCKILDRFKDKKLLALTATPKRADGKNAIKTLTPMLVEGEDYTIRDIKYCLENKIIKPFTYLGGYNLNFIKLEYNLLEQLIKSAKISKDFIDKAEYIKSKIDKYGNDMYTAIVEDLHKKYDFQLIDNKGERWFIFYSTVNEAEKQSNNIRKAFEKLYNIENNPDIKLNIIHFNYNLTNKQSLDIIKKLNTTPEDNVIDIIVTVNKGSESLHPVNCRGVWMMRNTESATIATQQSGRGLTPFLNSLKSSKSKEDDFDSTFIIDAVCNMTKVMNSKIYTGTFNVEDRTALDINKTVFDIKSELKKFESKIKSLESTFGEYSSNNTLAGQKASEFLEEIQNLVNIVDDEDIINELIYLYNNRCNNGNENPIHVFSSIDLENGTNYKQKYILIRKHFINEMYCKHNNCNESKLYLRLYSTFGNNLFNWDDTKITFKSIHFNELEYAAKEINRYIEDEEGDVRKAYSNHVSKTVKLKDLISKLQVEAIHNRIGTPYTKFCIKNNIDIFGNYIDIVEACINHLTDSNMSNEFKALSRECSKVTSESEVTKVMIKYYIFLAKYGAGKGNQRHNEIDLCKQVIRLKYNIFSLADIQFTVDEQKQAEVLAEAIVRFTGGTHISIHSHGPQFQLAIIDLVSRNDISTEKDERLSELELGILQSIWKNVDNTRRNANINKLIEILPFYDNYTNFVKNKSMSTEDYVSIVNLSKSCEEIRRLTNTKEYKEVLTEYRNRQDSKKKEDNNYASEINKVAIKQIVEIDWTKKAANSVELLFKTLLTKKDALNPIFIDNSLKRMNITKTNMFMQIIGSDNPSLENVDKINSILINGVHSTIDEILLNKLYNKLSANSKRLLLYLDNINYFKDNDSLKSVIDNLVIK